MLKALIFDFDGLILDTESPEANVWTQIYAEHGYEFPFNDWVQTVGGYGISSFNPAEHLSRLSQGRLDSASMRLRHRDETAMIIERSSILPGVLEMIRQAKTHGLKLAIASSSSHAWVDTHAKRLGIYHHFDKVICSDDVPAGKTKPNPDLYLLALDQLRVRKDEAVVFEDSPNGVKAANRAGIFVVAVLNSITSKLRIVGADLTVTSLADLFLADLIYKVQLKH